MARSEVQGTELLSLISTRSRNADQSTRLEDNPVIMIYRKVSVTLAAAVRLTDLCRMLMTLLENF